MSDPDIRCIACGSRKDSGARFVALGNWEGIKFICDKCVAACVDILTNAQSSVVATDDPITAAAKVLHKAGQHHRWWGFDKPFEDLDPIGRSEFLGIVEQALAAADKASVGSRKADEGV